MTVTVLKRENGCVTLSDGRVIQQRRDNPYFSNRLGWEVAPYGAGVAWFRTLREALKAAGVQS